MSALTITNNAAEPAVWINPDGSEEPMVANLYVVPPAKKTQLRLQVKRFSKPFEMRRAEQYGGGTQTMVRLELRIADGPMKGRLINPMVSWSVGQKSKFGQIVKACRGSFVERGEEFDPYTIRDLEFTAMVEGVGDDGNGKPKYAGIVADTIDAAGANGDDTWTD